MKIKLLTLRLESNCNFGPRTSEKIRGYIGSLFKEDPLIHQHSKDGRLLYDYPRVQYKVIERTPYVIGLGRGVESLKEKFKYITQLNLDDKDYEIFEKSIKIEEVAIEATNYQIEYKFLTPWYALNQQNYIKYLKTDLKSKRIFLLKRILIGNILSISKCLGEIVDKEIIVNNLALYEFNLTLDDITVLGFKGKFSINFNLPNYIGLGKSVSRGFGTIIKVSKQNAHNNR